MWFLVRVLIISVQQEPQVGQVGGEEAPGQPQPALLECGQKQQAVDQGLAQHPQQGLSPPLLLLWLVRTSHSCVCTLWLQGRGAHRLNSGPVPDSSSSSTHCAYLPYIFILARSDYRHMH